MGLTSEHTMETMQSIYKIVSDRSPTLLRSDLIVLRWGLDIGRCTCMYVFKHTSDPNVRPRLRTTTLVEIKSQQEG